MSALRTALVGVLTALVGVWIAVATVSNVALPGMPGFESVQTVAHTPPEVLFVGGVLTVAVAVVLPLVDGHSFGRQP